MPWPNPLQPSMYVRTVYRKPGKQELFLILELDGDLALIENCVTGHTMRLPIRDLYDPGSWAPVLAASN